MRIKILGSGTSTGVPVPGCECAVCQSSNPKNHRLRCSAAIEFDTAGQKQPLTILIDTPTDLRTQVLRYGVKRIDAVLYTHTHADHIFGMDDLRCFNFSMKQSIPLYADPLHAEELRRVFRYIFAPPENYLGGALPRLDLNEITPHSPFLAAGETVRPLALLHGQGHVLGFRIRNFAYLTDCSLIPDRAREELEGLDLLVIDGLRVRPHRTHFTFAQAVDEINKIKPRRSLLTHLTHEVDHDEVNRLLREMTDLPVEAAFDGLIAEI